MTVGVAVTVGVNVGVALAHGGTGPGPGAHGNSVGVKVGVEVEVAVIVEVAVTTITIGVPVAARVGVNVGGIAVAVGTVGAVGPFTSLQAQAVITASAKSRKMKMTGIRLLMVRRCHACQGSVGGPGHLYVVVAHHRIEARCPVARTGVKTMFPAPSSVYWRPPPDRA